MGTATEAVVPVDTDTGGELFELASGIGADPLDCPVATVVVEIVPEIESPEVFTRGVVGLDIGEVEKNAIVSPAVIPDELVVVVHSVGREVLTLSLGVTGHEYKLNTRILTDQNLHVVDIALGIMPADAAPRPHDHIDVGTGGKSRKFRVHVTHGVAPLPSIESP